MLLTDKRAWLYSSKLYLAAVATLGISLLGNLARPYWAMATVYIVSQPVLGMTRARGFYRVLGTLLAGAAVVFAMNFVQTPLLMSLMLAAWLSGCLFVALLHRGPSGYVFMLASYTASFIGFQAVTTPEAIFDIAVARSEEIILGSLCAVIVASLILPASARPAINARIGHWMDDAALWARQVLQGRRGEQRKTSRRAMLAADVAQFDALITMARYDDPRHVDAHLQMQALRMRMLALLPVLGWIGDRLQALRRRQAETPDQARLLADIAAWIEHRDATDADALLERVRALRPEASPEPDVLLANSLLLRLGELIELWRDARGLQDAIAHGGEAGARDDGARRLFNLDLGRLNALYPRHVDWPMISFAALSAGVSLFCYCVLWIAIGWPGGAFGAMLGAVQGAFFASQDDPSTSMVRDLVMTLLAVALVGFYLFGVLPWVHDFGLLVLVLAPAFLPLGLLAAQPSTMRYGLPVLVNLATLLNLRSSYNADFQTFLNSSLSIVLGVGFAIVSTRLFRSVGAEWSARRLVRRAWRVIADAAAGHGVQDRELFTARMLDLLGQLAPRMAAVPASSGLATVDLLDEIRVGLNVIELRRARHDLPAANAHALDRLLEQVAAHYRAQVRCGHRLEAPGALGEAIDTSLARIRSLPPGASRHQGLLGLIGLRHFFAGTAHPAPAQDALTA